MTNRLHNRGLFFGSVIDYYEQGDYSIEVVISIQSKLILIQSIFDQPLIKHM